MPLNWLLAQTLPVPLSRRAYAPRCMAPTCRARRSPCSSRLRRIACVERLRSANTRNPSLHHRGCGHLSGVTGSSGRSRASAGFSVPTSSRRPHGRQLPPPTAVSCSDHHIARDAQPSHPRRSCVSSLRISLDIARGAEQDISRLPTLCDNSSTSCVPLVDWHHKAATTLAVDSSSASASVPGFFP
jgi:hypothetical protein